MSTGHAENFPIRESMKLQFRTDFINLFNHANFAHPEATEKINATQDARHAPVRLEVLLLTTLNPPGGRALRRPSFFRSIIDVMLSVRELACGSLVTLASAGYSAQAPKPTALATPSSSAQRGIALSESGHCPDALPLLKKSARQVTDKPLKLKVGLATVRCAMSLDQRGPALDALEWLNREFPHDPDVLLCFHARVFRSFHSRIRWPLRRLRRSYQAHELNAEALEMQGSGIRPPRGV